ncbi:hypothetical protein [Pelagibacterium sediminicola]|uniref:hypothetical protein n=1 Tax=Pelagibacterium sediminicola TaxID=2248761 RepID=UPI000E31EB24|nr:hypothetical protein [Pelagibacterium sediminicola]
MKYILARIRADQVFHGYDDQNNLISHKLSDKNYVEKIIRLDRILSFTENYIFIECPHDTVQTWEYEGSFNDLKKKLRDGDLLIG